MPIPLSEIGRRIFRLDGWVFLSMVVLTLVGTAAVYSVDLSRDPDFANFKKHIFTVGVGFAAFFIFAIADYTFFRATALWWYGAACALLVGVLLFGTTIRGTTGWFTVASLSFQPAELAKFAFVLMSAYYLSRRSRYFGDSATFVGSLLVAAIPAGLILLQPDFGSAAIIVMAWLGTMLMLGTKKRYWALFAGLFVVAGIVGWFFLFQDYQKDRILTFIDPARDALGSGYNVQQSLIAVGSGGLTGRGLGFGSQGQLRFLPEAQNDFIFAVIGEELGFIATAGMLFLYALICTRMLLLLRHAPDDFASIALVAAVSLFFSQTLVNIGGVLGFLPVTGVPLPLVSAGGSSFIMMCALIGFTQGMYRMRRSLPPFGTEGWQSGG